MTSPAPMARRPTSRADFQIAVFCALSLEADKVQLLFSHDWHKEGLRLGQAAGDLNTYTLGAIGEHNVVLVHLARLGVEEANTAASTLSRSFINVRLSFVVGICGAQPFYHGEDVFLGDCIIGTKLVKYDYGAQLPGLFHRRSVIEYAGTGRRVAGLLAKLQTQSNHKYLTESLRAQLEDAAQHERHLTMFPGVERDRLFNPSYPHTHAFNQTCDDCLPDIDLCTKSCDELHCDADQVLRHRYEQWLPSIHFGRIGSANTVMRSGVHRDQIAEQNDLVAFEMEGCGVWDHYPTIVLKAACDYADSHKNKEWQAYAAVVAASLLKAVLAILEIEDNRLNLSPTSMPIAEETLVNTSSSSMLATSGQVDSETTRTPTVLPPVRSDVSLIGSLNALRRMTPQKDSIQKLISRLKDEQDLLRHGIEYWSHMTIEGYNIYLALFDAFGSDMIGLMDLAKEFACLLPEASEMLAKWRRLDHTSSGRLPRPYLLALLYMLHVEYFSDKFPAIRPVMNDDLIQILGSFDKWVPCPCNKCKLEWNFASTNWGMYRGRTPRIGFRCPMYKRYLEKEAHRLDLPGTKWTTLRSSSDRSVADIMTRQCYRQWLLLSDCGVLDALP